MSYRTGRKWAPDVIRLCAAFAGTCRVCHLPIEQGSKAWRFTWSESRGQGHVDCGFWNLDDVEQLGIARKLLALQPNEAMPRELVDAARLHGIARRNERGDVTPTVLGFAFLKLIRGGR